MFIPCIPFRVVTYTLLIHRSPFSNFTFSFLIPTGNTVFLLFISKIWLFSTFISCYSSIPYFALCFLFSHSVFYTFPNSLPKFTKSTSYLPIPYSPLVKISYHFSLFFYPFSCFFFPF